MQRFGTWISENWGKMFLCVLGVVALCIVWFGVVPIVRDYVAKMPATAVAKATTGASAGAVTLPVVPNAKKSGQVTEDLSRSYVTVDFEGQKKGMAMEGVTFMDYNQLMDFAHKAIADGAKTAPAKKSAPGKSLPKVSATH
ncbi:MAG: hypothetical protein Q7S57_00200 [bacterium]|nr:hypothetical protein [bacterium]